MVAEKERWVIPILMIGLLFVLGCDRKSDDIPTGFETTTGLVTKGWESYLAGDFEDAIDNFESVLGQDVEITDAYMGLGWSYTQIGQSEKARGKFTFIKSQPAWESVQTRADVYAGFAAGYAAEGQDSLAVVEALKALDEDPAWTFSMDPSFTSDDLHLLLAQAYFDLHMYTNAKDEIDVLAEDWSDQFDTDTVSGVIEPSEWIASEDSTYFNLSLGLRGSFRLPQVGLSSIAPTGSIVSPVASVPVVPGVNIGQGEISEVTVGENVKTEFWTITCIDSVKRGGIFSVVGSKSGRHADYDITTGSYTSDNGEVTFRITTDRRKYFSDTNGDMFFFATTAANVPFRIDQVKDGNRVFISIDPKSTEAMFFQDVEYELLIDYSYFSDFGYFFVQFMEKMNEFFSQ